MADQANAVHGPSRPTQLVLFALLLWAIVWALLPATLNVVPPVDNIEQRVWAQGLEWGYHKHPPFPTWIYICVTRLVPDSYTTTYALALLILALGFVYYWRLARDLVGAEAAGVAVLLTLCSYYFTARASYFNHNTVLVALTYAAAFHVWRATRDGRWRDWLWFGVFSAAATLTKYQFGVFLLVIACIGLRLQWWRQPRIVAGSALAAGVWAVLIAAHVHWLVTHDFQTLRYAEGSVGAALDALDRLRNALSWSAQQLRALLGLFLALGIAAWLARSAQRAPASEGQAVVAAQRTWTNMLAYAPALVMTGLGIVLGTRLQNHWGTSGLQFIALPIAAWFVARHPAAWRKAILIGVLVAQCVHAAWFISDNLRQQRPLADGTPAYTADAFAAQAAALWRERGAGRLDYVVGNLWLSGTAALPHPDHPQVLIDGLPGNGPWVDTTRLANCGTLYIGDPAKHATDVDLTGSWSVVNTFNRKRGQIELIDWAIRRPRNSCLPRE